MSVEYCNHCKMNHPDAHICENDALRKELGCWTQFGQAVAKELGCLVSYADPRPDHGNAHILKAIRGLKNERDILFRNNKAAAVRLIELTQAKTNLQGCGDCDPCIGGRPDQCAVGAVKLNAGEPEPEECAHGNTPLDKGNETCECYKEKAHEIILAMFDKLDTTERRLAHCENEQAAINIHALITLLTEALVNVRDPYNLKKSSPIPSPPMPASWENAAQFDADADLAESDE